MGKIYAVISNLSTSFDGESVIYTSGEHKLINLIDKIHSGSQRDALNFSQDMYAAMRHEDEQKEEITR